jgi:GH15 family glucan-1,4-alpha-glucosidase
VAAERGLIAAPTTSLPEVPGGSMNWDYRFCWLRDASLTISALTNAGYADEAERWRDWLLRAVGGQPEHLQIMYRLDGGRRLEEYVVDLPGWRHARPVRIGNAAAGQRQLDVYGELLHSLNIARDAGIQSTEQAHESPHLI